MDNKAKNELTIVPGTSPAEMIKTALDGRMDLDKLEKFLGLQERYDANEAKKAYNLAMAAFKADPPRIEKDKKVGYATKTAGRVGYSHASLANITEKISAGLSKQGLSASWATKQNGQIVVTCKITHAQGHSEETSLSAPADLSGSKNAIQAIGSTISYLERYTILALTGLATHDMDDDGATGATVYISESQVNQLLDMVAEKEVDMDKFLAYLKIDKIEDLSVKRFDQAITVLKNKKKV